MRLSGGASSSIGWALPDAAAVMIRLVRLGWTERIRTSGETDHSFYNGHVPAARHDPGKARRSRRARTQPQEHHRRAAARPAGRHHRPVRLRQEQPCLRHDLRRGPAPLRREPVRLRPPVPGPDGEAGRRPDRRPLAGHLDRPEGRQPRTRARRSARSRRSTTTCACSSRASATRTAPTATRSSARACPRSSTRSWPCRTARASCPRPAHPRPQDGGRPRLRGGAQAGLRARPGGRRDARPRRGHRRSTSTSATRSRSWSTGSWCATPTTTASPYGTDYPNPERGSLRRLGRDGPAPGRGRHRRRAGRCGRVRGAALQREVQLPVRRLHDRRARAALVLVQLAARRVPGVHRPRRAHGVRRRARAQPQPVDLRGRAAAVVAHVHDGLVVRQGRRGGRQAPRLLGRRAAQQAQAGGPRLPAPRAARREGAHRLSPQGPHQLLRRHVRGPAPQPRAALPRDGVGVGQAGAREVHGRPAMPHLRRRAAQARGAQRHHRRPEHRPGLAAVGHRRAALGGGAAQPPERARAADRAPGAQGDPRAAGLPGRRRARLPDHRPHLVDALRRRGAAHPAGDADRLVPDGRPVHPRRAHHRPAPEGQRQAHRHARAAARPGQHADRRRARRGDHPNGRLGARHRPGCGRARRRGDRVGSAARPSSTSRGRSPARTCAASAPCPSRRSGATGNGKALVVRKRARAQPQEHRRRRSRSDADRRDRRVGQRQEHARDGDPATARWRAR